MPVYRIVFTGGPCGGKSTALSAVTDRLKGLGFQMYRVPEAATLLLGGGVSVRNAAPDHLLGIQAQMLRVIMSLEDAFYVVARATGRPAVLLCDRGHDGRLGVPASGGVDGSVERARLDGRWTTRQAL